uniref:phosphoserine transaminase n=1 Tax=Aceria tosichella TaxID=561515 RepID=A0A6G1SIC6_9ACAR
MASSNKKLYFTAGPAKIPHEVMLQVQRELLDYNGMNISVMEMSHRSKEFAAIIEETEANLRKLINIPDDYSVLFMHGGAKSQFDTVPMNLCSELGKHKVEYIINGSWSKMAVKEAEKYAQVVKQELKSDTYTRQPAYEELQEFDDVTYRYYCDNETIQGVEFNYVPAYKNGKVPLVCDMTSNFLSRPIDVKKFGVIFAGAQKNCGIAGLVIVIIRNDLIGKHMRIVPNVQNYQIMQKDKSLHNTPLTFAIYVANLCVKWALERGGLEGMDRFSKEKSQILYDLIDQSNGFYTNPVDKSSRSRMNVVFLLSNKDLEAKFLEESRAANLFELKGHRSVGGFRASLYNGIELDDVKRLAGFMSDFMRKHGKASS